MTTVATIIPVGQELCQLAKLQTYCRCPVLTLQVATEACCLVVTICYPSLYKEGGLKLTPVYT